MAAACTPRPYCKQRRVSLEIRKRLNLRKRSSVVQQDLFTFLEPDLDFVGWFYSFNASQPELRMVDEVAFHKTCAHLIWPGGPA